MRIEVEPEALISAGKQVRSLGSQLGMLSDALGEALGSGIASGFDAPGFNFALKYGHQADEFASTLADAANAFKSVGYLLEATGNNYKNADAVSTIGGSGPSGLIGVEPDKTVATDMPAMPNSAIVPPPREMGVDPNPADGHSRGKSSCNMADWQFSNDATDCSPVAQLRDRVVDVRIAA